jgi:predicted component of type VI protein secretion system
MSYEYYEIPLKLSQVMKGKQLEKVELRKAIHQNVRLILGSNILSYRFDPAFGSVLNKYQALTPSQKKKERVWREDMREDIQRNLNDMLQRYETRVLVKDAVVNLQDPAITDGEPVVKVKVDISGQLTIGRKENFHYPDSEVEEDAQEALPLIIPVGKK